MMLKQFFFKKLRKKLQKTTVNDTLELQYTSLLSTSPNLDIFTF